MIASQPLIFSVLLVLMVLPGLALGLYVWRHDRSGVGGVLAALSVVAALASPMIVLGLPTLKLGDDLRGFVQGMLLLAALQGSGIMAAIWLTLRFALSRVGAGLGLSALALGSFLLSGPVFGWPTIRTLAIEAGMWTARL